MYKHKNGLTLRKVELRDLEKLKELLDTTWYGRHTWSFISTCDQVDWYENLRKDKTKMFCLVSQEDKDVGLYKLNNIDLINGVADSAHDVFAEFQGKGLGYTLLEAGVDMAFEMLPIHRLNTEVLTNNIASRKTAINAGYTPEGFKRESVYRCGDRLTSEFFGLLREEWMELERVKAMGNCCNLSYTPKDGKN